MAKEWLVGFSLVALDVGSPFLLPLKRTERLGVKVDGSQIHKVREGVGCDELTPGFASGPL